MFPSFVAVLKRISTGKMTVLLCSDGAQPLQLASLKCERVKLKRERETGRDGKRKRRKGRGKNEKINKNYLDTNVISVFTFRMPVHPMLLVKFAVQK